MTEVAEQFTGTAGGEIGRISHWIGGKLVPGESGRSGPVFNPATGRQTATVDFASIRQPLGVAAGITPFNFPAMVPMWMWAPAIACGNTFVLKPSEKDPSASNFVAELLQEAGLPDGVFNVVHGDKVAVDALLTHPDLAAISFVGSTPIARYVYETATSHRKRCQALGGAKNHMVVLPDADIDMAADAAVSAGYGSAGERCMAVSMIVAVGHVADELVGAIKERIPKVKVGDGMEPDAEMGPLITREHRDRVASYVENAPGEGAEVVVDGRNEAPDGGGFFLAPSLLDNVKPGTKAYDDEIFGPVLGITRVETYGEAVRLVDENPYGNGVALFTRDGGVARQFQFDVQAGVGGVDHLDRDRPVVAAVPQRTDDLRPRHGPRADRQMEVAHAVVVMDVHVDEAIGEPRDQLGCAVGWANVCVADVEVEAEQRRGREERLQLGDGCERLAEVLDHQPKAPSVRLHGE